MARGGDAFSLTQPMPKMVLFSIAALASLVGAAIAQVPEPELPWRKSELALAPTQVTNRS